MKTQVIQVSKGHLMDGLLIITNNEFEETKEYFPMDVDVAERLVKHIKPTTKESRRVKSKGYPHLSKCDKCGEFIDHLPKEGRYGFVTTKEGDIYCGRCGNKPTTKKGE